MRDLPSLPYAAWQDSLLKLHLMAQILGKVRLQLHPPINHWWHVTWRVSARGLTTGAIPHGDSSFEAELDLVDHQLVLRSCEGAVETTSLAKGSIADFYRETTRMLTQLGVGLTLSPRPFKCRSTIPFAEDREHDAYDKDAVARAFEALRQVDAVFKRFRSRFVGKCSPVQLYWHSFDLAVTRFNGRRAPVSPGADSVTREAYSHEVISAGFWFGDDEIKEPMFYAYASPEPAGLAEEKLAPSSALWMPRYGMTMALYSYDALRKEADPESALLEFLQSSYEGAARRGVWDRGALEKSA